MPLKVFMLNTLSTERCVVVVFSDFCAALKASPLNVLMYSVL